MVEQKIMGKVSGVLLVLGVMTGCQYIYPDANAESAPRESFMSQYDRNKDGRVSTEEFDGRLYVFVDLDINRNSFISPDEAPETWPIVGH